MAKTLKNVAFASLLISLPSMADGGRIGIVSESDLPSVWVPAPGAKQYAAGYPSVADKTQDVCIGIGYRIQKDGSTSDFNVISVWNSKDPKIETTSDRIDEFVQLAAAVVSKRRYAPAPDARPKITFTAATFAFSGSGTLNEATIAGHCRIEDLDAFVERTQVDAYRRGSVQRSQLEKYQRENRPSDEALRNYNRRSGSAGG